MALIEQTLPQTLFLVRVGGRMNIIEIRGNLLYIGIQVLCCVKHCTSISQHFTSIAIASYGCPIVNQNANVLAFSFTSILLASCSARLAIAIALQAALRQLAVALLQHCSRIALTFCLHFSILHYNIWHYISVTCIGIVPAFLALPQYCASISQYCASITLPFGCWDVLLALME